ncbi:MAG: hypothetical protein LBV29_02955 [Azoarcus sp.]|jgi:hypothetical protein|nr:hypothetical protein [Azoarcus sp.]
MPVNEHLAQEQFFRYRFMADRGHYKFLQKADRCDKFFAGDQWEMSDLNRLNLQRRPAITINKILSTLSTVMGEQITNRSEVIFRPSNGASAETAEALTKVWMQIVQNNQLPWVRSEVFDDGIIRSRGFYDVRMDFSDSMTGEVRITTLNSKNVIIDPDAEEYDPDAWNDVIVTKWLTPQDIAVLYNEADAELLKDRAASLFPYAYDSIEVVRDRFDGPGFNNSYFGIIDPNAVRRNVRVLDRQYHLLDKQLHFVDVETGDMRPVPEGWGRDKIAAVLEKAGGTISTTKKLVKRVRWTVTADNVVLHDDWSPYKHFTVVPFFPYFRHGTTVGIVENLLGPQEVLNKVTSQELHVVNTTANSGWKIKAGALRNMSVEDLEDVGATTGLVLELDDVNSAEKIAPNQTPQGLDRISYKAEDHIKTISSVSDSMQGFDRADVAAKAIAYKQQRGSVNLAKMQDNLERTDYLLARNVLDLVQAFYTEPRIIHITHDDLLKEPEQIEVNQQNPETGEILNDLTLGEYNITITSTPYRATLEDSQFEQARALREIGVAIPDNVLIENSRLARRAEIVKQMQSQQESPEAQQQAELQVRAQQAEIAKTEGEAEAQRADSQLKMVRAQKEAAELQADPGAAAQAQQQTERAKAEMEHQREVEKMNREHALRTRELEANIAMKREEMAHNMQMKREEHASNVLMKRQQAAMAAKQSEQPQAPETPRTPRTPATPATPHAPAMPATH